MMAEPNGLLLQDGPSEIRDDDLKIDRLSSLPCGIHDLILSKLPICDAVRTSVLSSDWRYKWLSQSSLEVDSEGIIDSSEGDRQTKRHYLVTIVTSFLRNHQASLRRFSIQTYCNRNRSSVNDWLHKLSRTKLEEFVIKELDHNFFRLPSYLFMFSHLRSLKLSRCIIRIPPDFGGFKFLIELSLKAISVETEEVNRLILLCEAIERLTLLKLDGAKSLVIRAPALKYLSIDNDYEEVTLHCAPRLSVVKIFWSLMYIPVDPMRLWGSIIPVLSNLPSLEQLYLSGFIAELWAYLHVLEQFPLRNEHLSTLLLDDMVFRNSDAMRVCFSLLQSCPNIHTFDFSVKGKCSRQALAGFLREVNQQNVAFHHLRSVTLRYLLQIGSAFEFLSFIVCHSPVLELVTFVKDAEYPPITTDSIWKLFKRLKQSAPDSNAEFKFMAKADPVDALTSSLKRSREEAGVD